MEDDDFLKSLGLPYLGSRLLRVSELAREGSGTALQRAGYEGSTRSVSTITLLRRRGPMGVTEIAYRLKLSHPLIIKIVKDLNDAGLVEDRTDPNDNRRRPIALTPKGEKQAQLAAHIADAVGDVYGSIFAEAGIDLFRAVEAFEAAVARRSIADRLSERLAAQRQPALEEETG
ncbi:MAG: MarR family winged helix-turn-helix transcriptional regulator [Sphingomonas sp.]